MKTTGTPDLAALPATLPSFGATSRHGKQNLLAAAAISLFVLAGCDHVELGNLTGLLEKIKPAVEAVRDVPGERNSKNTSFVEAVSAANVRLTVERIRELSPILRDLENAGKIQIAGCIYDLKTGRVRFLPQNQR